MKGECRAPGHPRTPPGALRLVGGVTAAAGTVSIGHHCATVGPRWLVQGALGVSAKATVARRRGARIPHRSSKARRGRSRAGEEGRPSPLRVDAVGAFALFRFEGLDCMPGLLHRDAINPRTV